MLYVAHSRFGKLNTAHYSQGTSAYDYDLPALYRYVAAASHSYTHVGFCKRGGVVYSVAYHCNLCSLAHKLFNNLTLALGQNVGDNFVYPRAFSDILSRKSIVAAQKHNSYARLLKTFNGVRSVFLDCIRYRQYSYCLFVNGYDYDAFALLGILTGFCAVRRTVEIFNFFLHKSRVAQIYLFAVCYRAYAQSRQSRYAFDFYLRNVFLNTLRYRLSKGMLAHNLYGFCQTQNLFFILRYVHVSQQGLSYRYRTRLVEYDGIHSAEFFQSLCVFEQNSAFRSPAYTRDYCRRRCQAQSTGTGYNQYAHEYFYCHCGIFCYRPYYPRKYGNCYYGRHENTRNLIRNTRYRSLGILRVLDKSYYIGKFCLFSYVFRDKFYR